MTAAGWLAGWDTGWTGFRRNVSSSYDTESKITYMEWMVGGCVESGLIFCEETEKGW